jgi:hypothetical protein
MRRSHFGVVRKPWWLPQVYSMEQNIYGYAYTRGHCRRYALPPLSMSEESMQPESTATETAATETAERRDSARHAFICPAELVEVSGGVCITARTADLSSNGCYIDTLNPLPVGTRVRIWLTKDDRRVEFQARVASSHSGFGMGLIFEELKPEQKATLQSWIAGTSVAADQDAVFRKAIQADSEAVLKPNKPFATRLVTILQRKGILTHSEAAELLRDLNS